MRTKTPAITLTTREETLAWLAANDESFNMHASPVKSVWLCEELNRFERDGYVYNREAFERIIRENGLDLESAERRVEQRSIRVESGLLGTLIYYAQSYRREMKLVSDGWQRATQELLTPLEDKQCHALANGDLSGPQVVKVKRFKDVLRLCPPRSRTKWYADYLDWWIKPLTA